MNEIFLRTIITAIIIATGFSLYWLASQRALAKAKHQLSALLPQPPQKPVIVYFTTPDCAPCKTVQRPALKKVSTQLGDDSLVIEINAAEKPEVAKQWGVMSVPTTFLLDARGQARYVNHGVTRAEKLMEQLQSL